MKSNETAHYGVKAMIYDACRTPDLNWFQDAIIFDQNKKED